MGYAYNPTMKQYELIRAFDRANGIEWLFHIDDDELGQKVKSQCGHVVCLNTTSMLEGHPAPIHVLEWHNSSIKRVVRTTIAPRRVAPSVLHQLPLETVDRNLVELFVNGVVEHARVWHARQRVRCDRTDG